MPQIIYDIIYLFAPTFSSNFIGEIDALAMFIQILLRAHYF